MKYFTLLFLSLYWTAASAETSRPASFEGGPADAAQQGGVYAIGATPCPECKQHIHQPYNNGGLVEKTNPDQVPGMGPSEGPEGTQ